MGVLGVRFTEISAKGGKVAKGDIEVSTSLPNITSVRTVPVGSGKDKREILMMDFGYRATYMPIDAKIELKGELSFIDDEPQKVMQQWKKDKKLDQKISLQVINFLIKKCAVESIKIADDLQLPAPVKLPEVRAKKD